MNMTDSRFYMTEQPSFRLLTQNYQQRLWGRDGIALFYSFELPVSDEIRVPIISDVCADIIFRQELDSGETEAEVYGPIPSPEVQYFQNGCRYFGVRFVSGHSPVISRVQLPDIISGRADYRDVGVDKSLTGEITGNWTFSDQIAVFVRRYRCCVQNRVMSGRQELCHQIIHQVLMQKELPTLGSLVDYTGYSSQYLNRIFKEQTGYSLMHFTRILRVQRIICQRMMGGNDESIADIAAEMGYTDQSHMIREFRKYVGDSPSHYRKELQGRIQMM
ncbi:MAG: helix-turn-helix domain-containing protein [Bacilli bacterium]|jgi:AraC-like DNA-binding protein